mmetsp:Transcript_54171/g.155652  ORF Transcript_54171/g.155652 Transcript_54171/m.155652 type:complete len:797 (+) Transcript_54171:83-2473(+)
MLAQLPRLSVTSDPDMICHMVQEGHKKIGHLLDELGEAALLVDALVVDGPIVGVSRGFLELTGYRREEVLGANCRMMLQGVPDVAISRSARKNIRDYCSMCQVAGLKDISEAHSMQPNSRADGSIFMNLFMLGVCMVRRHPYILSVSLHLTEGLSVRLRPADAELRIEGARERFKRTRDFLRKHVDREGDDAIDDIMPECLRKATGSQPEFGFFGERLQDHCVLINGGFTAIRREPEELSGNCLVFGNRPVRPRKDGLCFSVHVDAVTGSFTGLPFLGFTRRRPVDAPDLFPTVSRCLGCSILIGGLGEAFRREQHAHYKMGFKPPPRDEVMAWRFDHDIQPSKRKPPVTVKAGDVLRCLWSRDGAIQLSANGAVILEFDTGEAPLEGVEYFAVVDVCFAVCSLTLMPPDPRIDEEDEEEDKEAEEEGLSSPSAAEFARSVSFEERGFVATPRRAPSVSRSSSRGSDGGGRKVRRLGVSPTNVQIDKYVAAALLTQGLKDSVASCNFCVTIADPRAKDCPLIAVSEEFERMTGFTRSEAVGVNCRFLNQGCDVDPDDLVKLRVSSHTGAAFTGVLPNRKKSGELFLNLLDLRGLTVAKHPFSDEDLWFLVGIQADVTEFAEGEIPGSHFEKMHWVMNCVRAAIIRELSAFALEGATECHRLNGIAGERYLLLDRPTWRAEISAAPELHGLPHRLGGTPPSAVASLLREAPHRKERGGERGPVDKASSAATTAASSAATTSDGSGLERRAGEGGGRAEGQGYGASDMLAAGAVGGLVVLAGAALMALSFRRMSKSNW